MKAPQFKLSPAIVRLRFCRKRQHYWPGGGFAPILENMVFYAEKQIPPFCALVCCALLMGCLTERDSPESCAYGVSQALDASEWDRALARLDSRACERGMEAPERALNRAAAHIGRGGYELTELVDVALGEVQPDEPPSELRFIRRLGLLGESPGALRELDLSLQAHQQVMGTTSDGSGVALLQQACRQARMDDLSETEKDACFLAGLFAHARFSRALTLLLEGEVEAWRGNEPLSCRLDRNDTGIVDGAEITSCALQALAQPDADQGTCLPASASTGAVRWERLSDQPEVDFRFEGQELARLEPLRIRVQPGAACTGRDERVGFRMLAPGSDTSLAITDGTCPPDVSEDCDSPEPSSDCWPCPVPRADGSRVLTLSSTLLSPLNREVELMLPVLPGVEADRVSERLEATRQRLCEAAEGTAQACETREDGATEVRQSALGAYFRR